MKALVIDDDDIARELIVSVLEQGGYETYDLPSPIGATQAILERSIDILVLDLFMPAMSGDKLAKMLRSNQRLRSLKIVLVSSCELSQLQHLSDSVKANAVVAKGEVRTHLLPALSDVSRRAAAR